MKNSMSQKRLFFQLNSKTSKFVLPANIHLMKHLNNKTDTIAPRGAASTFYKSKFSFCFSFYKHVIRFSDMNF
jgi:hypothetical protein